MQLNDYQVWTIETAVYPEAGKGTLNEFSYLALGLASEAGEVAGKVKKYQRDGYMNHDDVAKELGDCFWYLARLCSALGIAASDVLDINKAKLSRRKTDGTISGSGDNR